MKQLTADLAAARKRIADLERARGHDTTTHRIVLRDGDVEEIRQLTADLAAARAEMGRLGHEQAIREAALAHEITRLRKLCGEAADKFAWLRTELTNSGDGAMVKRLRAAGKNS